MYQEKIIEKGGENVLIQHIDDVNIAEVKFRLRSVKDKAPVAMYRAINDAVAKTKTETKRSISSRYHITQKKVEPNIRPFKASKSNLKGSILTRGETISLLKFKINKRKNLSAAVLRQNSPKALTRNPKAFIATMKNKNGSEHTGIFERKGDYEEKRKTRKDGKAQEVNKHNEKIRELDAPSIPQMFKSKETMKMVREAADETLKRRIEHYINYYLERG